MKRLFAMSTLLVLTMMFIVACGGKTSTPTTVPATGTTKAPEATMASTTVGTTTTLTNTQATTETTTMAPSAEATTMAPSAEATMAVTATELTDHETNEIDNGTTEMTGTAETPGMSETTVVTETTGTAGEAVDVKVTTGIDQLDSYAMDFTLEFQSKDASSKDQSGTIKIAMEVDNKTKDMHTLMDLSGVPGTGSTPGAGNLDMYEVGGSSYLVMDMGGTVSCVKSPATQKPPMDVKDMIGDIKGTTLVQAGEDVNGIKADHYTVDDVAQAFGNSKLQDVKAQTADVWIPRMAATW